MQRMRASKFSKYLLNRVCTFAFLQTAPMPANCFFNLAKLSRPFLVTAAFCFLQTAGTAQVTSFYSASKIDSITLAKGLDVVTARYKQETDTLQGSNAKYALPIYKDRFNNLKHLFDEKQLLTMPQAQTYLQAVAAELINHNPMLQGMPVSFWFAKSAVANAQAMGEGAVIVNMGLLVKLQNEAQLAFALGHELAHLYLKHSNNSIARYVNTLYSQQTQQQLKHIKNSEFNKRTQLEGLFKGLQFDSRRHSRDHESEADSLAVVFMRNTRFDTREALGCLSILDTVDNDSFDGEKFIRTTFTCREYPFKDRWLAKEEGLLGGYAKLEVDKQAEDSLKTHPDCKARIVLLRPAAGTPQGGAATFVVDEVEFEHLKQIFPYEIANGYYHAQKYTACLYQTFKMLDASPTNGWAITMAGQAFNGIADALLNHQFGNVVDEPGPGYPAGYNTLLQFMQNIYTQEVVAVNYYFLRQHRAQFNAYPPFDAAFTACAKNMAQQQ
jgi:Zn-dependent protease with chaperone function